MSFKQRQQKSARTSAARAKRTQVQRAAKKTAVKEPANDPRFANRNELRVARSEATQRTDGVRLQKALADAGVAGRRDCEQLIVAGRIHVNGKPVLELPYFVDPGSDVVSLDGVPVELLTSAKVATRKSSGSEQRTYLLINKPKGMITTAKDPEGRPTVLQMVPKAIAERERLFPVGRLDADSTGLLLLTNDGDLAYQLTHPKFGVMKEYRVTAVGMASDDQLQQLKKGMYLMTPDSAGPARSKRASLDNVRVIKRFVDRNRGDRTVLSIKLREGQNREIRRLLARIGLKVRELERVAIGPLKTGDLKTGQCKLLGKKDVDKLRAAVLDTAK
jgi:23S rRNA pseudouridine2605 synthase